MATNPIGAESLPVILPQNFAQAAAIMAQLDRGQIASTIEVLVNLLDVLDGDSDLEGECSEDEISRGTDWGAPVRGDGPGCVIADPDKCVDDDGEQTRDEDDWCQHVGTGPGCPLSDNGIGDNGGLSEALDCDGPHPMRGGGSGDY